jgi:hypothetical protein
MKRLLVILLIFLFPLILSGQKKDTGVLKAGFSKIDITPGEPVMLYGYASRKTPSEGVHDPLSARIAVFENGASKVLLVSSDIGSYPEEVFTALQKKLISELGFRESEIFLTTIHSHSSPILALDTVKIRASNVRYTEMVSGKLLKAVKEAMKNMQPVQCGTGTGFSPVGSNRRETRTDGQVVLGRNPYGITDKEVSVLKIAAADGKPLACLYDYATHSTSLGAANMLVSGDVLGLSAQFVEKILGDVISPVFAGASGNIDPWYRVLPNFNTENGWIPEPVLLGTMLGEEVVTVFKKIKDNNAGGEIRTMVSVIECPRKKASDPSKAPELPPTVPVRITAARIGNAAFIGFNVEMLTEIGLKIKAASPFASTFVISHCNGYSGYLAPLELYKEGGYEITSTPFETGSAEMIIKEAQRMLHDL